LTTLLTGGNGWVPSFVLRRLARRGERVVSFDLMEPDQELKDHLGDAIDQVEFVHGDVTDAAALRRVAEEYQVDKIIHAAAITPRLHREMAEPARIIDVNLVSTVHCLELIRTIPAITRMVYISSGAAWGSGHELDVLDEESPSRADGLYGILKHTCERICRRYSALFDVDVVAMRPASVYGPMERITPGYTGATELREMLRIAAADEPLLLNSLEGPYHDWTFVEDIAEGIELAWATPNLPHDVYSITCGRHYSIGDMLSAFQRHWPELEYREVAEDESNYIVSGDPPGPVPSNARMADDFGWTPPTSLDDGVAQYIEWIRTYGPQ
jgi:UDP-glucose 4-epimerase